MMRQPRKKVATVASLSALVMSLPILYASLLRIPPAALARDTTFWFLLSNSIIAIIAAADSAAAPTSSSSHGDHDHDMSLLAAVHAAPAAGDQLPAAAVAVQDEEINRDALSSVTAVVAPSSEDAPTVTSSVTPSSDDLPAVNASDATIESKGPEQPQEAAKTNATDSNHGEAVEGDEEDEAASETTTNKSLSEEEKTQQIVSPSSSSGHELAIVNYDGDDHDDDDSAVAEGDDEAVVPWGRPAPPTPTTAGSSGGGKQYWQLSDEELNMKVEEFITRFNREMRLQVLQEAGV
ncbi:hypothetical protein E2562_018312 [Oryza meyeriana var. granulata]|uniref:DUF4408 domain-containing protein n=1 Tax=Oryza meyeriana var. granulata TaxID=110450 RepID=A0A6G1CRF0_9ORYZ|nr:hypothetical protein E2562_018312 [Oryza meyeriana var. granulata]